jgi:hypothetical protein
MWRFAVFAAVSACAFEPRVTAVAIDAPPGTADALPVDAPPLVDAGFDCPSRYTLRVAGSCLRDVTTPATWDAAEADCETAGAHLVIVDDATENAAITGGRWIGYSERVTAGTFKWVTGVPTAFEGWAVSEPGSIGGASCVEARADGWHDDNCPEAKAYTCEFDGRAADPATF